MTEFYIGCFGVKMCVYKSITHYNVSWSWSYLHAVCHALSRPLHSVRNEKKRFNSPGLPASTTLLLVEV